MLRDNILIELSAIVLATSLDFLVWFVSAAAADTESNGFLTWLSFASSLLLKLLAGSRIAVKPGSDYLNWRGSGRTEMMLQAVHKRGTR